MMRILTLWILSLVGVVQCLAQPFTICSGTEGKGDFAPDYSYVGYRQGEEQIPDAPVVVSVAWKAGDQSVRIQRAIDYVSSLKVNRKTGLRGAVLLGEGVFELAAPLRVRTSGVVLRGSGREKTVLLHMGTDREAVVYMESDETLSLGEAVPFNALKDVKAGSTVVITRPSTKEWIDKMHCASFGVGSKYGYWGWHEGEIDVRWTRKIVAADGMLTVDAPLAIPASEAMALCKVQKVMNPDWRISNVGIENLTIDTEVNQRNAKDEDHAWDGVYIDRAYDAWVRCVNFRHLAGSAVVTQREAQRVTVEDCISTDPVSEIGGYRRRTFLCMGEQCLFQRCYSQNGIHDFVASLSAAGPNAFVQCHAEEALGYSGAVGPYCTGLLFDLVNIQGNDIKVCNMGLDGYGTGYNAAWSTVYQSTAAGIYADSLPDGAQNYVTACWAQFNGSAKFTECDNHINPYSLYESLLEKRLGRDVAKQCRVLDVVTKGCSNNPTYEVAAEMVAQARIPRTTLKQWIEAAPTFTYVYKGGAKDIDDIKFKQYAATSVKSTSATDYAKAYTIKNGDIYYGDKPLTGKVYNTPWWNGRVRYSAFPKMGDAVTRFVPGMEGQGTTTRVDSVIRHFKENKVAFFNQNYGLWYDRRRDDHERVCRKDGDVWAPFYEQAVARSGQGKAWDGLSKYDLTKLNPWYINRIKELANKGAANGLIVRNQHYFQHNIIEAGAHWVDSPWRPVNNINGTVFPEPVPFAADKRVWVAEYFYNIDNAQMRRLHKQYIMNMLDAFADCPNVVHSISEEYTGPLHFTRFWLETVAEWEAKTGKHAMVALSCTKDVQDAVLSDPKLAKVVDIIVIEQWYYTDKGLYAPEGGKSLAPRQYSRRLRPGKCNAETINRALTEYRTAYPDKAVVYFGPNRQ